MDHLRIYIEAAFSRSSRFLTDDPAKMDFSLLDEPSFTAVARQCAPSLSDDALRLIHKLSVNDWNHTDFINGKVERLPLPKASLIFRAIFDAAENLLVHDIDWVKVRFQNLFKWREVTRLVGEDLFVTAFLAAEDAFSYRRSPDIGRRLAYPPTLHNDNLDIKWLMNHGRLHELHTHLYASTNVFNINWVCLMNKPAGRCRTITRMLRVLEDVVDNKKVLQIQELIIKAARFRYGAWMLLSGQYDRDEFEKKVIKDMTGIMSQTDGKKLQAIVCALKAPDREVPDYIIPPDIPDHCQRDFRVYLGERYFLYNAFLYLIHNDDRKFVGWFRFYLLVKAFLREYLIQLNANHGFANFKRYQDVKGLFVDNHYPYSRMLGSLAIADAWRDSNIAYQEVRIAPAASWKKGWRQIKDTLHNIDSELDAMQDPDSTGNYLKEKPDYGIIYHFIKSPDRVRYPLPTTGLRPRDYSSRKNLRTQSHIVRYLFHTGDLKIKAIDAAASEFNCRPEAFGQAFRFLKHAGMKITFHAGEDYYDIADGLRAIDEAVTFLGMSDGDRIGHAIAMGIDPYSFYRRCERHVIVPAQWMLDNVVWLLFRSADWNINLEPATESFLRNQFHNLYKEIYGSGQSGEAEITERQYFDSLLLRSDYPDFYIGDPANKTNVTGFSDSWDNFQLLNTRMAALARSKEDICRLFRRYHFDPVVRTNGEKVCEFKVCEGYARLIEQMQHRMMRRLERKHIIIECCPSSNLLIGSLDKFRNHPAFRFHEVTQEHNHHLKITLNTDDLGVFQTSLANEYSYMALALAKERDKDDNPVFMPHQINQWLTTIASNGEKSRF